MLARFGARRALVGMIHVGALPGTPAARDGIDPLVERGGPWSNPLDRARTEAMARAFERLPKKA